MGDMGNMPNETRAWNLTKASLVGEAMQACVWLSCRKQALMPGTQCYKTHNALQSVSLPSRDQNHVVLLSFYINSAAFGTCASTMTKCSLSSADDAHTVRGLGHDDSSADTAAQGHGGPDPRGFFNQCPQLHHSLRARQCDGDHEHHAGTGTAKGQLLVEALKQRILSSIL
jgi:hypothetical protein